MLSGMEEYLDSCHRKYETLDAHLDGCPKLKLQFPLTNIEF